MRNQIIFIEFLFSTSWLDYPEDGWSFYLGGLWVPCPTRGEILEFMPRILVKLSGVKRMGLICFVKVSQAYPRARGTLREVLPFEKELYMAPLKICSPSLVDVTQP